MNLVSAVCRPAGHKILNCPEIKYVGKICINLLSALCRAKGHERKVIFTRFSCKKRNENFRSNTGRTGELLQTLDKHNTQYIRTSKY
jgi:hypothetical protein